MHSSPLYVLIVDDSSEDQVALRRLLSKVAPDGYTVVEADRGEQALAICRAAPPDCVLLDYRLPDRDGLAVLADLRTFTDVPVVLLTGVGHEALALEAFRRGAQDYLIKDGWSPEQLHLSIHRAVATVQIARERDHALARLDALVTSTPSGIAYLDRELRYVLINPTLAALNGQPPEAHLGRTLAEMVPGLAPQLEPLARQVLATGAAVRDVELCGQPCPHDGAGYDWLLNFYPVRGATGGVDGVGMTAVDISETRRTETALHASEARYQAMFEQNAAMQLLIDPDSGVIVDANPTAIRFYGYPRATLLTMEISAINQLTPAQVRAEMESARRERYNTFHFPHRLASGEVRAVEVLSNPIEVGGRQLLYSIIHDETERVGAEQALRASQQNLASLIENTDGSIWSVDSQYRLIVGNRRFHHDVGDPLGRAILAGESLVALPLPQEGLNDWRAWYDRALGGATFSVDVSTRFALEPRTMEYRFSPIRTAAGTITGVTVVGQDITAQQQAEATIARLAERLDLATRAAHIGVWDWDIVQNQLVWDERMYALYGVQPDDFTGAYEAWLHGVHPDDRAASDRISAQARRGERPYDTAFRVVWPDGRVHVLKAVGEVFWDAEGRPERMIGVNYDITERTQAEAELRRAVARLETLHTIDQAVLGAQSPAEMAALVIRHIHQLLPGDRAAVLIDAHGQGGGQLVAASDGPPDPAVRDALIAISAWYGDHHGPTLEPWQVAEGVIPPDLARHATVLRSPGSGVLLVIPLQAQGSLIGTLVLIRGAHDSFGDDHLAITGELADQIAIGLQGALLRGQLAQERDQLAQRVAERTADLSTINAELARAVRLKDDFLASMSHELRTPLNAILGHSELLREAIYGQLTPQQTRAIQRIEEAGQHLLALINDILELSKIEADKLAIEPGVVEVERCCKESVQLVRESATRKRLALTISLDLAVTTIRADARRLKQMLVNLLSNAVKFTPEGGRVGLEVCGNAEQQEVTFTVWDTGIGIAPADQRHLFQPFVQVDSALNREHTGTGLGLALVQRLAELHGGRVSLESAVGVGSRFQIVLPLPQHAPEMASVDPPAAPPPEAPLAPLVWSETAGVPPLVLVAEDHAEQAQMLEDYLATVGCATVVARNGVDAVALAEERRPALILMDVQMPMLDGLEAMRRIRAAGLAGTRIIAITAQAMQGDRERCLEAGADAYLSKPIGIRMLLATIAEVLARSDAGHTDE